MNTPERKHDYTQQLTSITQRNHAHNTNFDVLVKKGLIGQSNGKYTVAYWRTAKDVSLQLAVEIGGNWLEDQFPSAPYLGYRLGGELETRFIHHLDDNTFGIRFPFLIIRPHTAQESDTFLYDWSGDDFEDA